MSSYQQQVISHFACSVGLSLLAWSATSAIADTPPDFVRNGVAGFVVSHIEYALSDDASNTGACPQGMSEGYRNPADVLVEKPDLQPKDGELMEDFGKRIRTYAFTDPAIKNFCLNPELGQPDPKFRSVTGEGAVAFGIDLDENFSTGQPQVSENTCPHSDLVGMNGEPGIDNQFYRVVGCTPGYQPAGQANLFSIEMLAGSWGMLLQLRGVDDLHNDEQVDVHMYANGDPIQLSPARNPLEYATYTVHDNADFHASTQGRIVNGMLTTMPVEVRIPYVVGATYLTRILRDARLRVNLNDQGQVEGYLGGFAPVESQYDVTVAPRSAETAPGQLSPASKRFQIAVGKANAFGHTCEGFYQSLQQHADGYPDPASGQCTAISTQYRIKAIPAFIVGNGEGRHAS